MTQKSIDFKNIDIVYFKGNSYRIHFWYMSKNKRKHKRKKVNIKKNKGFTVDMNDLNPFLLDINKKSSKGIDTCYIN